MEGAVEALLASPKQLWPGVTSGATPMDKLRSKINAQHGVSLQTYAEFHAWSVANISLFWAAVWECVAPSSLEFPSSHFLVETTLYLPGIRALSARMAALD